jgi:outer membrane receptor protein involved in Fe transport
VRIKWIGASVLAMTVAQAAMAQAAAQAVAANSEASKGIEEVVVTASKRSEKLQKVPQAIEVLDNKTLQQRQITEFQDYVKYVPSLGYQTSAPNETTIYLRGVVDGGNANHSGPLPTVGSYLDEMPITTIGGTLDVHLYDMSRIEVLPGPQGTLYGASSESGTVRFITNPPNTSKFEAGYDVTGNTVDHGGQGFIAEGFVNIPINDKVAVRLVAFDEHDAGFIDNVPGTRTFATSGATINNAAFVKNDFNPVDTFGGRAALKVDLNDDWSATLQAMGQDLRDTGTFGYEPSVGDLAVQRFQPDTDHDRWVQAGLTVTGHIGDYTLTYAGGGFVRNEKTQTDYTDYSVFYDAIYGSGAFWQDKNGKPLANPSQEIIGDDNFTKESNEIRLTSPSEDRFRFIVGAFQEEQGHHIIQDYQIQGFGPQISVPGWANTIWLTNQQRTDRDLAAFTEVSYDIIPQLTITGGVRPYYYDNSLKGFFGFSQAYDELTGYGSGEGANKQNCLAGQSFVNTPCVDLNKSVTGSGETHKINLTYKIDDERLVYFTYSTGYRPGGVNRRADQGSYQADTLTNYELGFKSTWLDHRLLFNVALYNEDWAQFQFAYLGQNSFTIVKNAPNANIKGAEIATEYRATDQLTLTGGITLTDAKLTQAFCTDNNGNVITNCSGPNFSAASLAPNGTALPYTPDVKGYATARYTFPFFDWDGHVQGALAFQTRSNVGLRLADSVALGSMPSYATLDLSAGIEKNRMSIELFAKNVTDERGQENRSTPCTIAICTANVAGIPQAVYVNPVQPLTVGIRLSQRF